MITDETIVELERCLEKLKLYQLSYKGVGYLCVNPTHAAAKRASLDASQALARWRRTLTRGSGPK